MLRTPQRNAIACLRRSCSFRPNFALLQTRLHVTKRTSVICSRRNDLGVLLVHLADPVIDVSIKWTPHTSVPTLRLVWITV